jgi:hypothetical protein
MEAYKPWKVLCEQACTERDSNKLRELVRQSNRLLEQNVSLDQNVDDPLALGNETRLNATPASLAVVMDLNSNH